jgi:hypothetical protein
MRKLSLLIMILLPAARAMADEVVFTTGIITGAAVFHNNLTLEDGADFTFPISEYLANKTYGAQIVPTGSNEKNESYVQVVPLSKSFGFASSVSTGAGALEVGVENGRRLAGTHVAFSRFYTTIKNNADRELDLDFFFTVEPGSLAIRGIRNGFLTAHARAEAFIDYRLLSPSGPFGGTNDETTGRLFNYFVDIDFDDTVTRSGNANVTLLENDQFLLSYATAKLADSVALPIIPGRGELTVYYDMYAQLGISPNEVGGSVFLGDPTDLLGGSGVRFVQHSSPAEVPEPASFALLGTALAALCIFRHK